MLLKKSLFLLLLSLLFVSCRTYRNVTDHYNAWFLADEKMQEVHEAVFGEVEEDYNDLLTVFPVLDTTKAQGQQAGLKYVVEKASIPIQRTDRSKIESDWLDDCYLLIGQARLYEGDFTNAANTFRYVNSQATSTESKHRSLIWLLRTFVEAQDPASADFLLSYIGQQLDVPFSDKNAREFYLTVAHYYRSLRDLDRTVDYLELAVPLLKKRQRKARVFFLLGQLYQAQGQDEKAYENYQECIGLHPEYDMAFNAQLNAAQVFSPTSPEAIAEMDKYFEKLLRDQKNIEFLDRIYYEMGSFEERKGRLPRALEYYNLSLRQNLNNQTQNAYTYLKLGELHFEKLEDFAKASNYYDSALRALPPELPEYEDVRKRYNVLREFYEYYSSVERQDELLALAALSPEELEAHFEKEIAAEKQAIDEQIAAREANNKLVRYPDKARGRNMWYFYNENAVDMGKNQFQREWGERPWRKNWRTLSESEEPENGMDEEEAPETLEEEAGEGEERYADVRSLEERLAEVPQDKAALDSIHELLATSLSQLGKMYYYQLEEPKNAQRTLQRYTGSYTTHPGRPEALYLQYTLCMEDSLLPACNADSLAKVLSSDYPNSVFAKMLTNEDYLVESEASSEEVGAKYAEAMQLFEEEKYAEAQKVIDETKKAFPESRDLDRILLVESMILGRTKPIGHYKSSLRKILSKYPESSLRSFIEGMLREADK